MDVIFLKLFNMSIAASWLILAVIVLRLLLKKAPKWLSCSLWAIVAIRLACPFALESPFSLIPSAETLSLDTVQYAQEPEINSGVPLLNSTLNPIIRRSFATAPEASANRLHIWMFIAGIVWAVGVAVLSGYALISFLRVYGQVREAVPLEGSVWLCDAVVSPFILGVIRPRLYLPSGIGKEQMDYVLAHEQAHLKRKDHWWKPLGYLLLAVYWFNPLVWAAYILLCRDIELACDEKVIKSMDMGSRKAYSNALVDCSQQRRLVMVCPLAFGEVGVKERVRMVLNYKKPAFWVVIAAIGVCAAVSACFLTNPTKDPKVVMANDSDTGKIQYNGSWYNKSDLSEETIEWLNWYNSLPKGGQLAVSFAPNDLIRLAYGPGGTDTAVETIDAVGNADVQKEEEPQSALEEKEEQPQSTLEEAILAALREWTKDGNPYIKDSDYICCDFVNLGTQPVGPDGKKAADMVTCYGWELDNVFQVSEEGIKEDVGGHSPVALTFRKKGDSYILEQYWRPRDGSYYAPDIREKFPAHLVADALDGQKYIYQQKQSCYKQAVVQSGLDTDAVIRHLLDTICSKPAVSSSPYDYVDAHPIEYRELLWYGEYTLRYCFKRFFHGSETGLDGKVMAMVCEELLQTKGKIPADAGISETGQFWFDTLFAYGSNLVEPYL